ncbi:thermonuclease family protein [Azoarcus sp. KH32C]|uniref:thermonuclease family protein n=1 Tax=Azoarcus sp. KH32C TaxID=748247 RepID=UPI000A0702C5
MLVALLEHHAHGPLAHFGGELRRLLHGSIFSRVGASAKPGAIQTVTVEWSKRDRYGRLVGKLRSTDGSDLNLAQLTQGMAWWYRDYRKEQPREDQVVYESAEAVARANQVGP